MPKFKEGQIVVVEDMPKVKRHWVGRTGTIKHVLPLDTRGQVPQVYVVDLFGRREEGINPGFPLKDIYFHEEELSAEDPIAIEEASSNETLTTTKTLLKDIDKEIRDVQDAGFLLQGWGFSDKGSQTLYSAGTLSRLRDRFVQALKEDGVDIEE